MSTTLRPVIVGPLGPAQVACIRSWRRAGYRVGFVHVTDGAPLPLIRGTVDYYLRCAPDLLKSDPGTEALGAFLERSGASGVTCLSYDLARWLHSISGRLPSGTALWLPTLDVFDVSESKAEQMRLATEAGMHLLPTRHLGRHPGQELADLRYPVVLRPDDPTTIDPVFKMVVCEGPEDVTALLAGLTRMDRPVIAQPFVRGQNFVVHGYRTSHGESHHWGFAVPRMFDGVVLTLNPATIPPELADHCRRFVDALGVSGVYHFEFRHDPSLGIYYFLDFNGRLGGTTGKAFRAGFDEPALVPYSYEPALPEPAQRLSAVTVSNRQAVFKALIRTLAGRKTVFDYPTGPLLREAAALLLGLLAWRDEILDVRDPRLTIAYYLQKVYGA